MALYAYKAMNLNGRTVVGRLEAINLIDLEMRLKRMDLDFINGDTVKAGRADQSRQDQPSRTDQLLLSPGTTGARRRVADREPDRPARQHRKSPLS
jgi:type II secretory pathway component PulF